MEMDSYTTTFWVQNEAECQKSLKAPGNWEKIPLLYNTEVEIGTLVRYKGMVQDIFNPEYYSKSYSVINPVTKKTKIYQGKYCISIDKEADDEVVLNKVMLERHVLACIPIPGLNKWVIDTTNSNKETKDTELEGNAIKQLCLNPALQDDSKEVIVFMYPENEGFGEIKLNDVIEVVGFFDKRIIEVDDMDLESPLMQEKYCIHVVQYKLFPNVALYNIETDSSIWEEASSLHTELKLILTKALLGDSLAADYLLFYLVSTIYNRKQNHVPGKFSLNIQGIPDGLDKNYTNKLYSLISYLVVTSEFMAITIDSMNNTFMIPKKCYKTNKLMRGLLQLPNRTHLVLDETNLQPGPLNVEGTNNLQALKDIVSTQQIKYDFVHYTIDYNIHIQILTLSVGKSLLPCDIDIVLKPDPSCCNKVDEIIQSLHNHLNSQLPLLEKLRKYIALISTFPFTFSEDFLTIIKDDFVVMRKSDIDRISANDLHRLIMISKLIALCSGKNELNTDVWEDCKKLEKQRKLRNNFKVYTK